MRAAVNGPVSDLYTFACITFKLLRTLRASAFPPCVCSYLATSWLSVTRWTAPNSCARQGCSWKTAQATLIATWHAARVWQASGSR